MLHLFFISRVGKSGRIVVLTVQNYEVTEETLGNASVEELENSKQEIKSYEFLLKDDMFYLDKNIYKSIVLARAPLADPTDFILQFSRPSVSRKLHGRIFVKDDVLIYEDNSSLGSFVNDEKIHRAAVVLRNKDVIKLGKMETKTGFFYPVRITVNLLEGL